MLQRIAADRPQFAADLVHPLTELLQLLHQRLHAPRPQAHLLHQLEALAAPAEEGLARLQPLLPAGRLANQLREIPLVGGQQMRQRREIVRHAGQNLLFGQPFRERHLDRAVKRQVAAMHARQGLHGHLHGVVAAEHGAAETLARDLDLLGQRDLLVPREQRDLRHLRQVHADRVVAELGQIVGRQDPRILLVDLLLQFVGGRTRLDVFKLLLGRLCPPIRCRVLPGRSADYPACRG